MHHGNKHSCTKKTAVMTPLNSENGKNMFRTAVEEVIHQQFAKVYTRAT
jgi:hypothetical protein